MSPALISGTFVWVLPWSSTRCPRRSAVSLVTLFTVESGLGDHLDECLSGSLRGVRELGRDVSLRRLSARVGGVGPRLHRHEIDHSAKRLLLADRQLNRHDGAAEHAAQ